MDTGFIGLIFSAFSDDGNKVGKIEVTAFQAVDASSPHRDVMDADPSGGSGSTPSSWRRREVFLSLHHPGPGSTVPLADALERVVRLQDTLFGEERAAYLSALKQNEALTTTLVGGKEDLEDEDGPRGSNRPNLEGVMARIFCAAAYQKSLGLILGDSAAPLVNTLMSHLENLRAREASLERQNRELSASLTPSQVKRATDRVRELLPEARSANATLLSGKVC
ncbi:unnamed protein product [Discosporangium mesarthrocarpum]